MNTNTVAVMLREMKQDGPTPATRFKHFIGDYGILLIFAALLIFLAFAAPNFLTLDNIVNVVRQSSIIGIVALGMTFIMITSGIDLSVGSVVGLAGMVFAILAPASGSALWIPLIVGLSVGLLVGFLSAALVVWGKVLPFLATLATMAIARTAALVLTDGQVVSGLSGPAEWLGAGFIGPIPVPVIIFIVAAFICDFVLSRTKFGSHVYAVGGNEESSRKVGISVSRVLFTVYLIGGGLAALGGLVLTARLNGAAPTAGLTYELQVIAAVVIGGTSLFGGVGTIRGTVIGVLLLGVVMNGMNLLGVSSYYQQGVQGVILVLAVLLTRWKSD
ncbi:ABC transporter permease [Leucobacter sp. cx-328]|uniref:ABC transporter permease n=1 Tax=unclassified Leucobacter TaxID=2621730 RepID=UPI00165E300C|nr:MULTISPECIES: ABC transporter permease [unclassified Leucobacter]MBC9942972.1 ABC transporter permease [Leucobacter sp. cx-328]MBC9953518.1 ABC transporter permease [Leucobacter sp. cx-42]